MGFKDELNDNYKNKCIITSITKDMSEADAEDLYSALSEKTPQGRYIFQASKIAEALRKRGYQISDRAVQRYRKEHF